LGGAKIRLVFRECFGCKASEEKSSAGSSVELEVRTLNKKGGTWTRWLMLVFIMVVAVRCKELSCSGVVDDTNHATRIEGVEAENSI
jgi:hypothetical protein